MASFTLFDGSTVARTLLDGEFGFIGQLGALATDGVAVSASGSAAVTVLGSLHASGDNAIDHTGEVIEVYVGQLGAIGSNSSDTVSASIVNSAFVSNDGAIFSGSDALDIRSSDAGASINILNTGSISGASDGIVTNSGDDVTRIVNRGSIMGATGGIDHLGGDAVLINRGDVSGEDYGYSGAADADTVRNFGTILGGVLGEDGDDVVFNAGYIDNVDLGDDDDLYDGRGGAVTGGINGGFGADTLRGGDGEDVLRGGAGADLLRGRVGDDTLRGDAGADIVIGSNGDDSLFGGAGADTFRFSAGQGFDTIRDLGNNDTIDLEELGLRSFNPELRDAIRDVRGGAVIDLDDAYGLTIFAVGVDADELTFGDFLI